MTAKIVKQSKSSIIVQFEVQISTSMLGSEESLQKSINEAGALTTGEILKSFDTDGSPIVIGNQKLTSKGKVKKTYHTPYGEVSIPREVYQGTEGGKTFCPLDRSARIITKTTPKMGKMLSSKYSSDGATRVIKDLEENHNVKVSKLLMQNVCDVVGTVAIAKEEDWNYELPEFDRPVKSVSIGLDGTCMLLTNDGWREAMVGTIALFNYKGERIHTTYVASNPEYGKETFISKFENEITRIKSRFPKAIYVGVADGARDNWPFLNQHTECQVIDFWHAAEYLGKVSKLIFQDENDKEEWMETSCHKLKHNMGGASRLLAEVIDFKQATKLKKKEKEEIKRTISYFTKNKDKMKYYQNVDANLPIGSGVTEAACKVIVKQRLCNSGMRWKDKGASVVLTLRTFNQTDGRWEQFWNRIDRYGFPIAA